MLHHQVVGATVAGDIVQRDDIGMIQRRRRPSFLHEPTFARSIGGLVAPQDLDGDGSVQPRVFGAEHLPHAAGPDRSFDLVGAELRARLH